MYVESQRFQIPKIANTLKIPKKTCGVKYLHAACSSLLLRVFPKLWGEYFRCPSEISVLNDHPSFVSSARASKLPHNIFTARSACTSLLRFGGVITGIAGTTGLWTSHLYLAFVNVQFNTTKIRPFQSSRQSRQHESSNDQTTVRSEQLRLGENWQGVCGCEVWRCHCVRLHNPRRKAVCRGMREFPCTGRMLMLYFSCGWEHILRIHPKTLRRNEPCSNSCKKIRHSYPKTWATNMATSYHSSSKFFPLARL